MTPMQKLVRLREIQSELREIPESLNSMAKRAVLLGEFAHILASVAVPPMELFGETDPRKWTHAFSEAFPSIDPDTAEAWFAPMMHAAYQAGGNEAPTPTHVKELIELLRNIREGIERGVIRAPGLIMCGERVDLRQVITRALNGAGVE